MEEQSLQDISREEMQSYVDLGERLDRLIENDDFKAIITDGYLKQFKDQYVGHLVGANTEEEKRIVKKLAGIGALENHLKTISYNKMVGLHNIKLMDNPELMQESIEE